VVVVGRLGEAGCLRNFGEVLVKVALDGRDWIASVLVLESFGLDWMDLVWVPVQLWCFRLCSS
jgi:hypothetical protein